MSYDRARFYPVDGLELPSVTTFLGIIDKSGPLTHWAVNKERQAIELALLEVLTGTDGSDPNAILKAMDRALKGAKAMVREKDKAAAIGTAAHAWVEWRTRTLLGEDAGDEPKIPDASQWACEAWDTWRNEVDFTPLMVERVVTCKDCGYAGTTDWIGKVRGRMTLGDTKTSKGIYPEMFLQVTAYRHAARVNGIETEQAMILRLPKVETDPAFEAMVAPEIPIRAVQAALTLWRALRWLEGKPARTPRKAGQTMCAE